MNWDHLYTSEKQFVGNETMVLEGSVVHGFKRGSKELGIPTANISMDDLGDLGEKMSTGIYYGHAKLIGEQFRHRPIYPTVVSVGWNPFYKNEKKAIEAHLITDGALDDFYDERLSVTVCGYLRDETSFKSLEELISCINEDIARAMMRLKEPGPTAVLSSTWATG